MFDKKADVDRHVETCLKKTNSESERNLRGLAFAKLYLNVGELELARRYVSSYLSIKPDSAEAHQLLGKILEKLGRRDAALEEYRNSLELEPKQSGLILKVCELLAEDEAMESSNARYWCEQAQQLNLQNQAVFHLREKLISSESKNPEELRKLLLSELELRPTDVSLRVRLLNHLLQTNQINDAYKHVAEIEQKNLSIFVHNFVWYEILTKVLVRYKNENLNNKILKSDFWMLIISVLDKLATLSLDENSAAIKPLSECLNNVFNLDQMLLVASEKINEDCREKQYSYEFFTHYKAQLCLHIATLVFKQARKDQITFKEAINLALPLLLVSYHSQPADLQSVWLEYASEVVKKQVTRWHREASLRCSQAGHMLQTFAKGRRTNFMERIMQLCSGSWREKSFKNIFITRDQQTKMKSSFFVNSNQLDDVTVKLPDNTDLFKYDEVAQWLQPDSLHNLIWIGLNNQLSKFRCSVFDGLQYSIRNLNNCAAETLNVLDIEAFVYCCILCAQSHIEDTKQFIYFNQEKPNILPVSITEALGSTNQVKWFSSAYRMVRNEYGSDISDLRVTLIKGIEIVRCVGSHGLDVKLLVQLASIFTQKAKHTKKQSEIEHLEIRADMYWKAALVLLEKLRNNQAIVYPMKRWFEYRGKDLTPTEINNNIEEGKLFLALQLMKKKDHEKTLQILENLRSPYASFYQAQTYKLLADEQMSHNKENLTSEMRSQNIILLSKARDCFYLTLDRLREPTVERKHPLNAQLGTEIEKIERMLSRIDPDTCGNRNDCDNLSDENVSSVGSAGDHAHIGSSYIAQASFLNGNLTPRNDVSLPTPYYNLDMSMNHSRRIEARPSPERLDAQLRQMVASKDAAVSHILEQNKMMVESHRNLVDELRSFKEAVTNLTLSVDELKGIKKSVEELKQAVDDLQNLKETVEQVHEIKKDLAELRRDTTKLKNNQINDEDLYALDDEYNVDYGLGPNAPGFTAPPFYPNFPQRLQGPNALAYGAGLYGMYPMYSYGGLGLGQPGALPFPEGQIPDLRSIGSIGQGLSHAGLVQPGVTVPQPGLSMFNKFDAAAAAAAAAAVTQRPVVSQTTLPTTFTLANQTTISSFVNTATTLPVNVVITASDPLPTTSASQPILSVTIPPQHLKGNQPKKQPHNYQIPLPSTTSQLAFSPVSSSITSIPLPVSTQNLLQNVAPPVFSSLTVQSPQQTSLVGSQLDKSPKLNTSNTVLNESTRSNQNVSESSILEEHDPCPDFKPIIPLPDEVHVTTGEENETVLFCERAKLFRFVEKEWKERGIGNIKILHNEEAGKVRVLMRREQVHKICANHYLTSDMMLSSMPNNDRAFIWAANDYSDENVVLEKLCVRFKNSETANKFQETFNRAKMLVKPESDTTKVDVPKADAPKAVDTPKKTDSQAVTSLGGFVFTSTPTFKPKSDVVESSEKSTASVSKQSPFAGFSFTSVVTDKPKIDYNTMKQTAIPKVINLNESGNDDDDFVPTAEFKPVVPLPEIVEVKTGEENSEVLHEDKAKLLRFDSETKEWKERGVGIMKILKDKTVRLVMRREQVHKVCCNHQLLKSMVFTNMPKNSKVLNWCAQDFSDNVLKTEMFAIRFRTPEMCDEFLKAIQLAQSMLDSSNNVIPGSFQPKENVWECPVCCIVNDNKHDKCIACGSSTDGNSKSDSAQSPQKFKPSTSPQPLLTWSDKPKHLGTWECKTCYVHNDGKKNYCEACDTPKNDTIAQKDTSVDTNVSGDQFSFGFLSTSFNSPNVSGGFMFGQKPPVADTTLPVAIPPTVTTTITFSFGQKSTATNVTSGWGDKFKPKAGSWECKSCYLSNSGDANQCVSCLAPKLVPLQENVQKAPATSTTSGWGDKFKPKEGSWVCKSCYINNASDAATCIACNTPKEGIPATISSTTSTVGSSWGDKFKPKEGSWSCKSCYVSNTSDASTCVACSTAKDGTIKTQGIDLSSSSSTKFIFGKPPTTTEPIFGTKATSTVGFSFGIPQTQTTTGFTFGVPTSEPPKSTPIDLQSKTSFNFTMSKTEPIDVKKTTSKDEFVFGSPNKYDFEFKPRSPRKVSGGDGDDSDGSVVEDEGEHIYFKPVIPLPDKVDVKTGEEDEEVLYCHRAKLFRFIGEWKERGIGDIKILKQKQTGKLRVVMRREQVLKICLNHALTNDIKYSEKDDRTWLFSSADYSDGEIKYHQFCIRFKNAEIAKQFMDVVNKARSELKDTDDSNVTIEEVADDEEDVVIIYELKVTPEEEEKALALQLPKNFYAYLQKPPCKGCIGCNPDDFVYDTKGKPETKLENPLEKPAVEISSVKKQDEVPSLQISANNFTSVAKSTTSTISVSTTPKTPTAASTAFSFVTGTTSSAFSFSSPVASTQSSIFSNSKTPAAFSFTLPKTDVPATVATVPSTKEHKSPIAPAKLAPISSTTSIFSMPKDNQVTGKTMFSGSPSIITDLSKSTPKTEAALPSTSDIDSSTSSTTNVFSPAASKGVSDIFSTNSNTSFSFTKPEPTTGFSFGSSILSNTKPVDKPEQPTFRTNVFGGDSMKVGEKPPIFGGGASLSFGALAQQSQQQNVNTDSPILNCNSDLTFAALASGSSSTFIKKDESKPFMFEGAGTPVFGSVKPGDKPVEESTSANTSEVKEDETEASAEGGDDNYDPHYEPIVPLPDQIIVKTGEEDEEVLFIDRVKLYRFSEGQWKERGVGQIKILHHPVNNSYRFLMRREQVHKLVLNQLITGDLDLQPMQTSDRAWLWGGYNYSEDGASLEKLAVRFKNTELAQMFYKAVESVKEKINSQPVTQPAQVEQEDEQGDVNDDENDDYNSDESDERSIMFSKRCTLSMKQGDAWVELGMGQLKIYYDSELYGGRIVMHDDHGEQLSNTVIAINTVLKVEDTSCIWRSMEWSLDPSVPRILKARFSSHAAAQEMYYNYDECMQYAHQSEIVDNLPQGSF